MGVNLGLRYDYFGTLVNTGVQDAQLALGLGSSIQERIADAHIAYDIPGGTGAYNPARNDWSGRIGFSYDLDGKGTLLRGGFGVYYDRPFGLLFQNVQYNDMDYRAAALPQRPIDYLQPVGGLPGLINSAGTGGLPVTSSINFPEFNWIDHGLRTPHVQTWFAGIEHKVRKALKFEISQTGSLGRKLIATDNVNRPYSLPVDFATNPSGYLNPQLPQNMVYLSTRIVQRDGGFPGRWSARLFPPPFACACGLHVEPFH